MLLKNFITLIDGDVIMYNSDYEERWNRSIMSASDVKKRKNLDFTHDNWKTLIVTFY